MIQKGNQKLNENPTKFTNLECFPTLLKFFILHHKITIISDTFIENVTPLSTETAYLRLNQQRHHHHHHHHHRRHQDNSSRSSLPPARTSLASMTTFAMHGIRIVAFGPLKKKRTRKKEKNNRHINLSRASFSRGPTLLSEIGNDP